MSVIGGLVYPGWKLFESRQADWRNFHYMLWVSLTIYFLINVAHAVSFFFLIASIVLASVGTPLLLIVWAQIRYNPNIDSTLRDFMAITFIIFVVGVQDSSTRVLTYMRRDVEWYNPFVGFVYINVLVEFFVALGFDVLDAIQMDKNRHLLQLAFFPVQFYKVVPSTHKI